MKKYWEYLDLDEKDKQAFKALDKNVRNKKIVLVVFLICVLIVSYQMKNYGCLSKNAFELIFTAFIGGFLGSSLNFIISGDR